MPITYKTDVLKLLKEAGYSTYRLRKEKIFGELTIQKIRKKEMVSWETISAICRMAHCQLEDILEYKDEKTQGG